MQQNIRTSSVKPKTSKTAHLEFLDVWAFSFKNCIFHKENHKQGGKIQCVHVFCFDADDSYLWGCVLWPLLHSLNHGFDLSHLVLEVKHLLEDHYSPGSNGPPLWRVITALHVSLLSHCWPSFSHASCSRQGFSVLHGWVMDAPSVLHTHREADVCWTPTPPCDTDILLHSRKQLQCSSVIHCLN